MGSTMTSSISFTAFKKATHHKHVKFTWTAKDGSKKIERESKKFYCNPCGKESLSLPRFLMTKKQTWYQVDYKTFEATSEYGKTIFHLVDVFAENVLGETVQRTLQNFQIRVSRGGLFVQSTYVAILATSKDEAIKKAVKFAEENGDDLSWDQNADNYNNYQMEEAEKLVDPSCSDCGDPISEVKIQSSDAGEIRCNKCLSQVAAN